MKKIILFLLLTSLGSNAQYVFKVVPKTFTDELGISRTVIGITAKSISSIDVDLNSEVIRIFTIGFQLSDSTFLPKRTVDTEAFIQKSILAGAQEEQARTQIKDICYKLEYGTSLQKYNAAVLLAQLYGYALKPKDEQE